MGILRGLPLYWRTAGPNTSKPGIWDGLGFEDQLLIGGPAHPRVHRGLG